MNPISIEKQKENIKKQKIVFIVCLLVLLAPTVFWVCCNWCSEKVKPDYVLLSKNSSSVKGGKTIEGVSLLDRNTGREMMIFWEVNAT